MGGGGGGGGPAKFKAVGEAPSFDYQSAQGLNQLAIGGDVQGYGLSDQDFANRYPALQAAYNQYQAGLNNQGAQVQQGAQGQADIMSGLANQITGRLGTQTTGDINAMRNQAATAAGAVGSMYGLGAQQAGLGLQQAGLAGGLVGMGQQQAGLAGGLVGMGQQQGRIGQQISQMGGQLATAAQTPYQVGQQLLQEPIDPMTQQQMMQAGLSSAAGALGAGSLGQGMAGQAAAARQLGLNTLQYGQAMRGEAMQDIGQYASMLGQAGQLKGLGGSTIGAGGQTIGLGGQQIAQGAQTVGLGGQQLAQGAQSVGGGAQTIGQGAQTAIGAGGLYGGAQGAQEQYVTDTGQLANVYSGMQNNQASNYLGNMANASQMFQKRPFGMGGTNLAQTELGQANALNSFNQANYATLNGIAFNQSQLASQQNQINAANQAGTTNALIGAGSTAAITGATAAALHCWVARACFGENNPKWKVFRHWMLNVAHPAFRQVYLRHGEAFSVQVRRNSLLRAVVRFLMDRVIERTTYVPIPC